VADSGLRDLGTIVPGRHLAEPDARPFNAPPPASQRIEPETASSSQTIFAADRSDGTDALGLAAPLGLLAELAAHKRTETPLTIGLFGPSGSGKSFALTKLIQSIEDLSRVATPETPYLGEILTLRIDATDLAGNPATALAGALHASLARTYPTVAAEAARAARDPRAAASEALERLDVSRRKLEAEKRALEETSVRRARLAEATLYETTGSQADAYAAANRTRIKSLLSRLGIAGDPLTTFKDMIGTVAGTDGVARRTSFALRAFFAFKGQTKLVATAILLFLAGVGLRIAFYQQAAWLAWLRATESSVPFANWFEAHMDWLLGLREIIFLGAALALGVTIWRGAQLLRLVFRGADLLQADLDVRRRELDDLFAFQARRVEVLAAEANIHSRRAAEAERQAGDVHAGSFALAEPAPFAIDTATEQARTFAAAAAAMIGGSGQTSTNKRGGARRRIVFAIDHLDGLPASRGREILVQARSLFKQGFVVLIAADPSQLAAMAGETTQGLDKWIQVPFQLGEFMSCANYTALAGQILGAQEIAEPQSCDASTSVLDQPLSAAEAQLLAGLAPLAGSSARALKRFVNLYRLARAQDQIHKGALAFMLALDAGGTPSEISAVNDALSRPNLEVDLDLHHCGARIAEALAAAQSAQGRVSVNAARRAVAAARLFSFSDRGIAAAPYQSLG
jgi:KAP family P-loop domain